MEEWRPIKGFEGLAEVSSEGRVRSLPREIRHWTGSTRIREGTILAPTSCRQGYLRIGLWKNGKLKTCSVHSLVAEAFIGERPEGLIIRHIDRCTSNNVPSNLEYGTHLQNNADMWRHGTIRYGMNAYRRKLTDVQVRTIRNYPKVSNSNFAMMYGVSPSTIWSARTGRSWKYLDKSTTHRLTREWANSLI